MALRYVPLVEFERIRAIEDPFDRTALFADACRVNTLYSIMRAGSGHIGTSFSAMEILSWLYLEVLEEGDRQFSSKGHDAPGTYAVMAGVGKLPFDGLHALRRRNGLPGHPDVLTTPQVATNTGSLGMGVSKARGFVLADRMLGRSGRVYVLTGDGELQEGQFWESLLPTSNRGLHEITVVVDHNKLQSDTWVAEVSDLGDIEARVQAHGWVTARCDGNDPGAFAAALADVRVRGADGPQLIVADTVKGKGVSFMEPHELPVAGDALYAYHSGAPSAERYELAAAELVDRLNGRLAGLGLPPVALEDAGAPVRPAPPATPQRVVTAYGEALVEAASGRRDLVALDGDLYLDTGLVPFRGRFPERFFECGIAEQDMVSQAGTMALSGLLPVVHSFGCFLTPRANEQIFNNASEGTKVIYSGSLIGVVPAGPGHSHQMVRDIALMASVPGMSCIEPFCDAEAAAAVRWAVEEATGPVYLRQVTVPWDLGFAPPAIERLVPGRGTVLREGDHVLFVTTGPVLVAQAMAAAERLAAEGVSAGVVALPWLKDVDGAWLAGIAGDARVVTVDNHYLVGGQGDAVLSALASAGARLAVQKLGVDRIPVCGTNDEALREHGLDADGLVSAVLAGVAAVGT